MEANYLGTLNDERIDSLCKQGILISRNFNPDNVSEACYELSAGNIYYDITQGFKRIDIEEDNYPYILIKPKQSVVVITKEELNIPANYIGRVLTKGKLFSIGLLPINTYADPGFQGNLGIILHNMSTNYLKLKEDELIAKIEFSVLQESVRKPYTGQHGYKTKIWPIPVEFTLSEEEIKSDKRIGAVREEIEQTFGSNYSQVIKRLLGVEKKLIIAAIFYFIFSLLLIALLTGTNTMDWFSPWLGILLGLVTNLISFFVIQRIEKSKWLNGK